MQKLKDDRVKDLAKLSAEADELCILKMDLPQGKSILLSTHQLHQPQHKPIHHAGRNAKGQHRPCDGKHLHAGAQHKPLCLCQLRTHIFVFY